MKNKVFKSLALFLALTCLISTSAFAAGSFANDELEYGFKFGEVFVQLLPEYLDYPNKAELFPELEVTVIDEGDLIPFVVLGIADQTPQGVYDAIDLLSENPCVDYVTPCVISNIYSEPVEWPLGDVNADGRVSNADIIMMAKHIVGTKLLAGYALRIGDANGDGTVTNADLVIFARKIVGAN